jgi:hypothetical protein
MADCEQARAYVHDKLSAAGVSPDPGLQGMIEDAVKACCADTASVDCVHAIGKIVGTVACDVATEGACPPCCSAAMNVIAPIIKIGLDVFVSIVGGAWDWVKDLFGGGSCSYQGAADQLISQYATATRSLVAQMEQAWGDARVSIGLPREETLADGKFCNAKGQPGGVCNYTAMHMVWVIRRDGEFHEAILDPILVEDLDRVMQETGKIPWPVKWEALVLGNAARVGLKIWPYFTWSIKGDSGARVWMDMINFGSLQALTPESYFSFRWVGFPCNEGDLWQRFASDLMAKRQEPLGIAVQWLAQSMASAVAGHRAYVKGLLSHVPLAPVRPKPASGPSAGRVLLGFGLLAGAAGLAYHYWPRKAHR